MAMTPGGVEMPRKVFDADRLEAVRATGLMGTDPEDVFDDLAGLAATVTGCSRAFITLVDDHRVFCKSSVGVDGVAVPDSPIEDSFCKFLIALDGEPLVVQDVAADPRTRDNPSVGPAKIGAWAGYPVLGPGGEVLGSMCVVDENPHDWQPAELATLATVARAVSNEINLRISLSTARDALAATRELARSLQDSLLPPRLSPVPGLDAAASYLPAAGGPAVVGDFYDLFHARGPWWGIVMGDVCGKGTEAAKVTALARYTLRAEATRRVSPAEVLRRLNDALLEQQAGDGRFLTAVHAMFRTTADGVTGRLCTAGHPPALVRRADGRVRQLGEAGTLLGVLPDTELTDVKFRLGPGDLLLLYTDGATEARPPATGDRIPRRQFGDAALAEALAGCADLDAAGTVACLERTVLEHSAGWASDDTALLALRVPPAA